MAESLKVEGNAYFKKGEWKTAIEYYDRAIGLEPGNATYYSNKAAAAIKLEDWSSGLDACQTALGLSSVDSKTKAKLLYRQGVCQRELGSIADARKSWEQGLSVDPSSSDFKRELEGLAWLEMKARRQNRGISKGSPKPSQTEAPISTTRHDSVSAGPSTSTHAELTAARGSRRSAGGTPIPVTVVPTLPDKFKPREVSVDSGRRLEGSFELPKELPSMYTMAQIMRAPAADMPSVYAYVFDLPPEHFANITGAAGIDYELVEFVLDAIASQHGKHSHAEWRAKSLALKQGLEKCRRYDIASMFVSSAKSNAVDNLLSNH